jgi:hypothetical protein
LAKFWLISSDEKYIFWNIFVDSALNKVRFSDQWNRCKQIKQTIQLLGQSKSCVIEHLVSEQNRIVCTCCFSEVFNTKDLKWQSCNASLVLMYKRSIIYCVCCHKKKNWKFIGMIGIFIFFFSNYTIIIFLTHPFVVGFGVDIMFTL